MAPKLSGGRANSWRGLTSIGVFYWPTCGLHIQGAFLLEDSRNGVTWRILGQPGDGSTYLVFVLIYPKHPREKSQDLAQSPSPPAPPRPVWPWANHFPSRSFKDLPVKQKVKPRQRVETMLLPSYLPTFRPALAFSLILEDPGLRGQPGCPLQAEVGVPGLSCCGGRGWELVECGAILSLKCDFQCLCLTHALLGLNDKGLT